MLLKELIKILKDYTYSLLNREGWGLAFELFEKQENYIVLKLKDKYIGTYQALKNDQDVEELIFEIPSFLEIFQNQQQVSLEIKDNPSDKNRDTFTIYEFKRRLLIEIGQLFTRNKILLELFTTVQENNYQYISSVHIKNFYSIKNIHLKDIKGAKEVYFLGENGDGKSLVLMGIHLAFNGNYIRDHTNLQYTGKITQMIKGNGNIKLSAKDDTGTSYGLTAGGTKEPNNSDNYGYYIKSFYSFGVHRGRYTKDKVVTYGFMTLYDSDLQLYSPEQLMAQIFLLELEKRLDVRNMAPEVKDLPNWIPVETLQSLFQELLERNVKIEVAASEISFAEKGFKLSFNQLSEGYKNIMVWISDLLYHLQQEQPKVNKLEDFKGIVLLDEIELHLHPLWQERLVGQLRNFFPQIQFIFTTHSPTIIQGASEEAIIYRIFRDAKTGETKVSEPYYKKDLDHLMFNTLVTSPLFGLENARISKHVKTPDTSDSFLQSRVSKRIEEELKKQKDEGKEFLSDSEIDTLIDSILTQELKK